MAHTGVNFLVPIVLSAGGTLSAADGWDFVTMEFPAIIWRYQMNVGSTGASSGNTDAVVERTDSDDTTTDLWTVGSGVGRIAYNASAKYLEWDWENAGVTGYDADQTYPPSGAILAKGDTLTLNVNAVPGTASENLKVVLWVKPIVD